MKQMKYIIQILVGVATAFSLQSCIKQHKSSVTSPDEKICLLFSVENGVPTYQADYKGERVIEASRLGMNLKELPGLSENFELLGTQLKSVNERWEQPWGEFKTIVDNHNELTVNLRETTGEQRQLDVVFRVFNDGLGFRYVVPKQDNLDNVVITDELTEFNFPEQHDVWWIPVHSENSYYESLYKKSKIGETDIINTPATFETKEGMYLAVHEANLTDYASMTLRKTSDKSYRAELVPWANGDKVYATVPFKSPWRTIIIGEKPGDLVTSTLTLNLNEPCAIEDISWIEPSKYIGIWWGMHIDNYTWGQGPNHGATTENSKRYIDFAAKHGFNGVLVEGWNIGWDDNWAGNGTHFDFTRAYDDFDLEEVCRYAAIKNIRLIGHHETGGAASHYESQMEDAFQLYRNNGVNAVKTGYVDKFLDGKEWHDGQYGVRHYRKVIETAAKYHIMIDTHEPVKGTGLQRTYPNLMAQEGGRGQEWNAWSSDGGNPPSHTTIIPFTRMLAGPFDFTPGTFNFDYESDNNARVQTTLAKQLALYVIIFSPMQMASDMIENYEGVEAFEFIKQVPVIWSDTKIIDAKIGEFVITARKDWDSANWYLGAISNEQKRQVKVDLSFLDKDVTYKAEIYADGEGVDYKENPYPVDISVQEVTNEEALELDIASGGGTAIKFIPI